MLNGHQAQRDFVCGTIATLSRSEQADSSPDAVINGLLKITDHEPMGAKPPAPKVSFEFARALSHAWALTEPWKTLGFAGLRRVFRCTRSSTHIEALARLMAGAQPPVPPRIKNSMCCVQTEALPAFGPQGVTHQQLMRSLDALLGHQDEVDAMIAGLPRPLIDEDLSMVFYELTSIRREGLSQQQADGARQ